MQLRAPAKINLSFRIQGRRDDGYHEIETLMSPVSLYDELTFTRADAGSAIEFTCDDVSLPTGEDNLVLKAARLFLATAGLQAGLKIELRKRIPHGAGLGGGSSDAATALLGLNELFGTGFDLTTMSQLGAQLGSDVPFFIFRSAAFCRGRGELVEPTTLPERLHLLLLKPAFGVSTPWAYARWKDSCELRNVDYGAQRFGNTTFVNDLERPVFEKHLFLARAKTWLRAQPEVGAAMLSGSGSTLFAVLRGPEGAGPVAARAKSELDEGLWTCACETVGPP